MKFVENLRYIHRNPVRRGLVEQPEDWVWSSFRHHLTGETIAVEIESQWTARPREQVGIFPTVRARSAEEIPTLESKANASFRPPVENLVNRHNLHDRA